MASADEPGVFPGFKERECSGSPADEYVAAQFSRRPSSDRDRRCRCEVTGDEEAAKGVQGVGHGQATCGLLQTEKPVHSNQQYEAMLNESRRSSAVIRSAAFIGCVNSVFPNGSPVPPRGF